MSVSLLYIELQALHAVTALPLLWLHQNTPPLVWGTYLSNICHAVLSKGQACACNQQGSVAGALSSAVLFDCAAGSSSGAHSAQLSL